MKRVEKQAQKQDQRPRTRSSFAKKLAEYEAKQKNMLKLEQ